MDNSSEVQFVPGVGRIPYPAYRGKDPYIFISYAHADSEKVFAEIKRFNEAGYNVWYDEGIAPGNEWTDEIADALADCAVFVVMITPTSASRENVMNEINFALDEKKPFIAIHLEETELKRGLKLQIGSKQAILKYNMRDDEYEYKFIEGFTKMGLKRNDKKETAETAKENEYNDSPQDAIKRANGDLVRVDGFDIEHGSLKGYYGSEKDIKIPNAAIVIGYSSFGESQRFIESVDLNKAGCLLSNSFENCPNLLTVKVPPSVTTIKKDAFVNCPNMTLYVRKSQLPEGFEESFRGKQIVYLDE
jgi:hypothetical protein